MQQPTSIVIPETKRMKHLPRRWSVGRREARDEMRLYLLGGQQLLENFEGVWAVAAASDLEGGGAEFGVFVGEVGDARGEGQGVRGLFTFGWRGGRIGGRGVEG